MYADVSVVIPCYRCAATIERAVESVLRQTLRPAEVFLVDDHSNDDQQTLRALLKLRDAHPSANIQVLTLDKNVGAGGARNAAWCRAKKSYIAFLDADDTWHPAKLALQLGWMQAHPGVALTATKTEHLLVPEQVNDIGSPLTADLVSPLKLLLRNNLPTRTVMLRREVDFRFDPHKRYAEDYWLWLRIVFSGLPAYVLNAPLGFTHKSEFSSPGLSTHLWKMWLGEIDTYRRLRRTGFISLPITSMCIFFSLLKFIIRLSKKVFHLTNS
jgi:glycosyltransferase involved in cell wall biosynthesis